MQIPGPVEPQAQGRVRGSRAPVASAAVDQCARELRATAIGKCFDGLHALRDVSLVLREGEVMGLIGPNGSGKTTLLNVISGSLRPTSGSVVVNGEDVTDWPPHRIARKRVARTFQNIRLFGRLTVLENVEAGLAARPKPFERRSRSEAREILREINIAPLASRLAGTLPYGDQRRVELARAIAGDPQFLLLDEPAAGMNPDESDSLLQLLRGLRDSRGFGLLVVDHDLRLIMGLCERLHVLNQGVTIVEGPPTEVRQNPEFIEAYLGVRRGVQSTRGDAAGVAQK